MCAEHPAKHDQSESQGQFNGSQRHISQIITVENSLEGVADMLEEKLAYYLGYLEVAYLVRVLGVHGHINHNRPQYTEPEQHIGLEKKASAYLVKRQTPGDIPVNGGKTICRIKYVPVSGRELRHER